MLSAEQPQPGIIMLRLSRRELSRGLVALLCIAGIGWLVLGHFFPAPPSTITFASGVKGGNFEHIARRYQERLALRRITLNLRPTSGSAENVRLLEDRNSGVDVGYSLGGNTDSKQSSGVKSLGRVTYNPIWFFYRGTEPLDRLTQLKGKRIAGNFTAGLAGKILAANGVNADNATLVTLAGQASAEALKNGEVDVMVAFGEVNTPTIQSLLRDPTIRLMSLSQADAMARVLPFLTRVVLPQGAVDLEKNIPSSDVSLVATTTSVIVRKDLHPELAYLLAQTLSEEHGGPGIFHRAGDFPTQTDPEFPVAEEAREFYRNGPSFMQRHLPFWMVRLLALLLAAAVIVIPIFNYAPRLYRWIVRERTRVLYQRLRVIEKALQSELVPHEVEVLQGDLEHIDRAASILRIPLRHSDLFFSLKVHINLMRMRIASRLAEVRTQTANVS
jgi:TRAP-type uncharacterized transport system substrate-binding protein